jgi:hypothetical protein
MTAIVRLPASGRGKVAIDTHVMQTISRTITYESASVHVYDDFILVHDVQVGGSKTMYEGRRSTRKRTALWYKHQIQRLDVTQEGIA